MLGRRLFLTGVPLLSQVSTALAETGPIIDGSWVHTSRKRNLAWRLRLPAGEQSCPLVIYSHGLGGSREGAHAWGTAWADAGIAVLHLQHPGSDLEALRAGRSAAIAAASASQLIERLQDLYFAVDEVVGRVEALEAPWKRIRLGALGYAGHSFGALTIQAAAGQRYAGVDDLSDPRPKAFVALSPSLPIGVNMPATHAFEKVARPFFALTGSLDASPLLINPWDQRAAVYRALPPGHRALLWLAGARHQTFGGGPPRGSSHATDNDMSEQRYRALIATATSAWWRWRLIDDDSARLQLESLKGLSEEDQLLLG